MKNIWLILFSLVLGINLHSQEIVPSSSEIWQKIEPYFSPPAEYKDEYGSFRSPLVFYDGQEVERKNQWKKRKQEIRNQWMSMMGEWPPLNKKQRLTIVETEEREDFIQHRVTFQWTPNQETYGYLLIPKIKGKKPAVVSVYYEPETAIGMGKNPYRDFAYQMVKRGFVTLSLGTAQSSLDKTYSIYYPNITKAEVQPLSMLAYAAANAWYALSHEADVDKDRIGIVGHSYGGKWAMFASCLFDKFACAAWSDPGIVFQDDRESINYWEPWYLGYHPKPWRTRGLITADNPAVGLYPTLREEGYNLQELHALMAPRPFLVSGGAEDGPHQWIPLNHSIAVNDLLGYQNRVAMSNRPDHSPNVESNEIIYSFFQYFLDDK